MEQQKSYTSILDRESILSILNKISLFGGLSENQLSVLLKLLQIVSYHAGEYIFKQGEAPSHIYIVKSGSVKIVIEQDSGRYDLVVFGIGECFGETSVIGIQPHSAHALAQEDTELLLLPRNSLLSIFNTDPTLFGLLILNIAREACRRLYKTDEILFHYVSKKE